MKHIKTGNKANLSATAKKGGCGKCQASCQSACKTSCTVGNQKCANEENRQESIVFGQNKKVVMDAPAGDFRSSLCLLSTELPKGSVSAKEL